MNQNNSPLEYLAAFSIVLVAGIVSTIGIGKYIEKLKADAKEQGR